VSFATLVGSGDKFLAEKYFISHVASGRDLLRENKPSGKPGDGSFSLTRTLATRQLLKQLPHQARVALRSLEMRDLQSMRLIPLPGIAAEAAALEKRLGKAVKVFLGPKATEADLRQVSSPRILHLADSWLLPAGN
jgi:hypothetical protein